METHNKVEEKTQIYVPYNILPLDPDSQNQAIMRLPEVIQLLTLPFIFLFYCLSVQSICLNTVLQIQAAVAALRNTRGLPWTAGHKKKLDEDILDWLQSMFGFQVMLTNILF